MIVTPKIFARIVAIVIGVLLQLSFFSRVELFHTSADVLPALVVSLGLLGGSLTGAVAGFSIGFLVDCLLVAPLGGSSLVLIGAGYLAGLFRERFDIHSALVPPLVCMGLTLFAELGFAAIAAVARDRRAGQRTDRPRHAAEEHLRLLPRLADLLRPAAGAAPGAGRGAEGERRRQPTVLGPGPMYRRSDERGPPMSNRLALRMAVFGGVALALFGVLFFRLWLLQVIDGEKYLAEAKNNRTRAFRVSAPRGKSSIATATSWSPTGPAWRFR